MVPSRCSGFTCFGKMFLSVQQGAARISVAAFAFMARIMTAVPQNDQTSKSGKDPSNKRVLKKFQKLVTDTKPNKSTVFA
jgi:hypothetical protein